MTRTGFGRAKLGLAAVALGFAAGSMPATGWAQWGGTPVPAPSGPRAIIPVPAVPAATQAGSVTLENLNFTTSGLTYRVPSAEFRGTSQTKQELEAMLSASSSMPMAARVSGITAREIVIPQIVAEMDIGGAKQITTYRDVVFRDVAGGKIGSVVVSGGTMSATGNPTVNEGTFGRFSLEQTDLLLAVRLSTEKAGPTPDPLAKVYGAFSLDDLVIKDEKSGITTKIARMAGRDFSARTTKTGWMGFAEALGKNPKIEDASPEDRKVIFGAMNDIFDSFEFGLLEMTGMEFSGGKPGENGRIARVAMNGGQGGRPAELLLDGLEVDAGDGRMRVGSMGFAGFSFKPVFAGLETADLANPENMSAADLRKMLPTLGTVRMSGLDFDVPGDKDKTGKAERIRFSVGGFEFSADKAVEGIPSDLRLAVRNVAFVVPPGSENEAAKQLKALGYDRLDVSLTANVGWNPGSQEFELREVSLAGADVGSAVVRGKIGNVTRDIFNPDTAVATVAALGATARSLEIVVENKGLADRILTMLSRQQGRSVEDIRREAGAMAMLGIPAMLGNAPAAKAVGQTVAKFVAKPGRLVLKATAKSPAGVGVADVAAGPDPVALMDMLDITSSAD